VLDPEVVWDATDGDSPGMNQIYHGRAGVRRFWQTWLADLTDVRVEIDELIDCGERVFAAVHAVGRGRRSGAASTTPWFLAYTVRAGLIVRMTGFRDREAALQAARRAE
jgi:ketosteroid isomerase-like protein